MKHLIIFAIMLFIYPWDNSKQTNNNLLFEGMYTITGRSYNELTEYDSPMSCQAIYIKVYENKLVATMSVYGSGHFQDIEYMFENVNKDGNRIYRKDNMDAFAVDSEQNIQRITSTYSYNGNKRVDTYCEVIKGDYSAECQKRMQNAMEAERMKSIMDMDGGY